MPAADYVESLWHYGIELWDREHALRLGRRTAFQLKNGSWSLLRNWELDDYDLVLDSPSTAWVTSPTGLRRWEDGTVKPPVEGTSKLLRLIRARDGSTMAYGDRTFPGGAKTDPVFFLENGVWKESFPGPWLGQIVAADIVNGGSALLLTTSNIAKYESGVWKVSPNSLPFLRRLSLVDVNNGWAVGANELADQLFRLKDGEWQKMSESYTWPIVALKVDHSGRGYMVTSDPAFYKLSGESWVKMAHTPIPFRGCGAQDCDAEVFAIDFVDGLAIASTPDGAWVLRGTEETWRFEWNGGRSMGDLSAVLVDATARHHVSPTQQWYRKKESTWIYNRIIPALAMNAGMPGVIWAVGEEGTLASLKTTEDSWSTESFLDLNTWTEHRPTDANLYGVAMNADGSGWAVGGDVGVPGVVLRRSANVWTKHAFGPSTELHAIALESPDTGWAVGGGQLPGAETSSLIARLDAGQWREIPSPTTIPLWSVALDAQGNGWAVGGTIAPDRSVLLRLKAGTWSVVSTVDLPSTLRAVVVDPNGYGWAAGTGPYAVSLVGDTATVCPDAFDRYTSKDVYAATIDHEGRTWVVGESGFRAHSP